MPKKFTHPKVAKQRAERLGKAVVASIAPGAEPLFTTHEIAKLLQVHPSSVAKWIDETKLTAYKTPGGHRRVRRSHLIAFLERYKMPVPAQLTATR